MKATICPSSAGEQRTRDRSSSRSSEKPFSSKPVPGSRPRCSTRTPDRCSRKSREHGYRIGYAFSDDLINWTRDDEHAGIDVSADGWDSEMQCYPSVFACDRKTYLLYNGNEFGRLGFGLAVAES